MDAVVLSLLGLHAPDTLIFTSALSSAWASNLRMASKRRRRNVYKIILLPPLYPDRTVKWICSIKRSAHKARSTAIKVENNKLHAWTQLWIHVEDKEELVVLKAFAINSYIHRSIQTQMIMNKGQRWLAGWLTGAFF